MNMATKRTSFLSSRESECLLHRSCHSRPKNCPSWWTPTMRRMGCSLAPVRTCIPTVRAAMWRPAAVIARMELEFTRELDAMRLVQTRPQHDTFGIVDAMLVRPSQPNQSVLYQRVSRRGRGQMPPLGSRHVDVVGTQLIRDWISSMEPITHKIVKHWTMEDLAPALAGIHAGRSLEQGRRVYSKTGCIQCHKMRDEGGGAGPNLTDVAQRLKPEEVLLAILEPSKTIHPNTRCRSFKRRTERYSQAGWSGKRIRRSWCEP